MLGVNILYVDCSYRTQSNLCFYDRVKEYNFIESIVKKGGFIIVWGPRNVGKSELLRYVAHKLSSEYLISYTNIREKKLYTLEFYPKEKLLDRLAGKIKCFLEAGFLIDVVEEAYRFIREYKASGFIWIIDEVHLLGESRGLLEALVKRVVYSHWLKPLTVIVCSSEGWFIDSSVVYNMFDYGAHELLVKPFSYEYFREFVSEYSRLKNIDVGVDIDRLYNDLVGGVPGAFISLVELGVSEWVRRKRFEFLRKIQGIVKRSGYSLEEILGFIARLPVSLDLKKLDYRLYELSLALLRENIVYHILSDNEITIELQLPVYKRIALELYG